MNDGKIHIPARKKCPVANQPQVKISADAYSALVDMYNESTLSMKDIASIIILESVNRVVYDKED